MFSGTPPDWKARVGALAAVASVSSDGDAYHISSKDGPATTMALLDDAANAGVTVKTLAVQATALADVFVSFTARHLQPEQPETAGATAAPARHYRSAAMERTFAIVER